jgi:anaerobic selenocysteine-containing dehydrogenase
LLPAGATDHRTTCPRDCYDACGIVVQTRPGLRPIIRGDPDHPVARGRLCQKCSLAYNGVFLDPTARLTVPLRRRGAKGSGQFDETTWDSALEEIADRLGPLVANGTTASVLNAHYTGTFAMVGYHFPLRFFHRLGATEVDPDTICNKAGHAALEYLYGTSLVGFDPRSASEAASILVWGANPSASAPHQDQHWLREAGCPVTVVDPLRTATASRADIHLQPRPGTDAALAFALLHVLDRDGLVDRQFVENCTTGYSEVAALLGRCTPAWAEEQTGVAAARIERAARVFGSGPSLLWIGQGLQRQPGGGNVVRSVALLPAVTGAIGRPGGGFLYLNGIETRGLDGEYLAGSHLAARHGPPPVSHMDLVATLEDPEKARALFCWNINIAASNPQQHRLRRALSRDDLFTVVVDVFPTDTANLADIVLPAATFLEQDDLVVSYFHHSIGAQARVMEAPADALPNSEIFRRLAAAMGWYDDALHESDAEIIQRLLDQAGVEMDFAELCRAGTVWPAAAPRPQFADRRFPTASGRIEIASARAQADGLPRVPQPAVDPPPGPGRLRLLSPASAWMLNGLYGNDRRVQRRSGPLTVTLSPREAATRSLLDGDLALVSNDTGSLLLPVRISDGVPDGVALVPKGRWPKLEPGRANVNALNPGARSDMADSSAVHGTEVSIVAAAAASIPSG